MILEDKELIKEIFDNPEDLKALEEQYQRRLLGLNEEDIEYINDECNQHYYVLNWYLDIFENYFKYKELSNVDIDILNSNKIVDLFSDQRFEIILENDIPQREVLGAIFEEVFNDAILRGKGLKLINLDSSIVLTAKNNYTKIILQNNNYTALLINALNSLIEELNYLFEMIYRFNESASFYTPDDRVILRKTIKTDKSLTLKDYFIDNTSEQLIKDIQKHFSDFKGKKMAIVINLLLEEFKLIQFQNGSNTNSREGFVRLLKGSYSNFTKQAINNCFVTNSNTLNLSAAINKDPDFIIIKNKLTEIIKNAVH